MFFLTFFIENKLTIKIEWDRNLIDFILKVMKVYIYFIREKYLYLNLEYIIHHFNNDLPLNLNYFNLSLFTLNDILCLNPEK